MDITSRAQGILLRPKAEWPLIDAEPSNVGALYMGYLVPLALVGAVARFIGASVVGLSVPFVGRIRVPILSGLTSAILGLVFLLVGVYVWALIINALAPTFGGRKDMLSALKLAIYSATPALVAAVLGVLPSLMILQLLAAIYGLYVLYLGFPVLMKVAHERAVAYTAATVVSGIVVGIVFGALSAALGVGAVGLGASRVADDAAAAQAGQNIVAGVLGSAGGGTAESRNAAAALVAGAIAAGQQAAAAQRAGAAAVPATADAQPVDAQTAAASGAAAVAALGTMMNGGKAAIALVPFQTLKTILPASAGSLPQTNASGESSNVAGVSSSTAEGTYGTGGSTVTVKISDMGNTRGVLAMGQLAFAVESENDQGFEKNVTLNGQKVHEKWTTSGRGSELMAFIGNRFMVEVNGTGVDVATAERAFTAIDFGKLAGAH